MIAAESGTDVASASAPGAVAVLAVVGAGTAGLLAAGTLGTGLGAAAVVAARRR